MTKEDVRRYITRLRRRGLAAATVAIHIRNIRTFLRWLWSEGITDINLALAIKPPKTERREELPLSSDEIQALLSACNGDPQAIRDRALILFLLDTGVRVGELVRIQRNDVHFNENGGWVRTRV